MKSLRRHLLAALWWSLLLVGLVATTATYLISRSETNELLDYQMEQFAAFALAQPLTNGEPDRPVPAREATHDIEDAYIISIRDAGDRLVYASCTDMTSLSIDWRGYRTQRVGDAVYRIFAAQSTDRKVAVGQQLEVRREAAAGAALTSLLPIVLLIPVLGLVISFVIRRQLQPLGAVAQAITAGSLRNLQPLSAPELPAEIQPLIDEINRLIGRLRDATELELRFITDAAHALRTPLTALQLQAEVLENSTNDAQRATRIGELRAGIRRTVKLTNQLLLLARQEQLPGQAEDFFDVDQALAECRDLYTSAAANRGIRLQLESTTGICVAGSMRQIVQLAGNLIDNAIRHTPDHGIVRITAGAQHSGVSIEVIDEGPGLATENLQRVFERFVRAPGDRTEGSGLGLAVVREMALQLGGQVSLTNRSDRTGLRACVWLPGLSLADDPSVNQKAR